MTALTFTAEAIDPTQFLPVTLEWPTADGEKQTQQLSIRAMLPWGPVLDYRFAVSSGDQDLITTATIQLLRAALPSDDFIAVDKLLAGTFSPETGQKFVRFLVAHYEGAPPPRPQMPPKPSRSGRRPTGGGSAAKRRSTASTSTKSRRGKA